MEILDNAIDLLNNGEFSRVISEISGFLDENPQYKTIDYYHFANPIEETLFEVYVAKLDSVKKLALGEALDELYLIYGIAYMETGNLELALKYLKTANQINPVSAQILMRICEAYQAKHAEENLKELSMEIFRYAYDTELLSSNYFKLADYYYHTGEDMELYDALFNFYMMIRTGEQMSNIKESIKEMRAKDVQIGFNPEVLKILAYLYTVHEENGLVNQAEYFRKILAQALGFERFLKELEE